VQSHHSPLGLQIHDPLVDEKQFIFVDVLVPANLALANVQVHRKIAQQTELVDQLKQGLNKLRAKREDLVLKRDELVSRAKMARAQSQVQESLKSVSVMDPTSEISRFEERIRDGYLYGDYQFATDATRDSFLARGIFSCYQPVPDGTPLTLNPTRFDPEDWARLTFYSHRYKRRAFQVYSSRYLRTSGQIYWADSQLSAAYVDGYHADLDRALGARVPATEMITETYVERPRLEAFMQDAARELGARRANVVYGTVRMIEPDTESYLAWATGRFACVIFNLHVEHTPAAIDAAAGAFRALIDLAIAHGGRYYLTYHRWARRDQVERCYPQMPAFLGLKRQHDPAEVFQSTWYRHYRTMFTRAQADL